MTLEQVRERMRGASSPASRLFGFEMVDAEEGATVVDMLCRDEFINFGGIVHGGVITALADAAMGSALATLTPDGTRQVSFDLKLTVISAAQAGETLRARGRVLHAGRRTAVCEAEVRGPGERLVAKATGSFAVYPPKEQTTA
ncbi:MAG TPA: PaaI family thioesterase [Candidatus Dormibacteraeota bacterium]